MLPKYLLLIIIGLNKAEESEKLKTALNEILKLDVVGTCDDEDHIFSIRNSMEKLKKKYLYSDVHENQKEKDNDKEDIGFTFGNSTQLQINGLFENLFRNLSSLLNFNLNDDLQQKNCTSRNYSLLIIEKEEKSESNSCCLQGNINYKYLEYMNKDELRKYGKFIICFFVALGNSTNNKYFVVQELLKPLEKVLQNTNSSKPMLVLLNSFLTQAMEGACKAGYNTLYFNYAINQLKTIQDFDKSELVDVQNISDLQIRDFFEKSKQIKSKGIVPLFLHWRLKLQDTLQVTEVSEYLRVMDETFLQALEDSNLLTVQFRGQSDASPLMINKKVYNKPENLEKQNLSNQITKKLKSLETQIKNSRMLKTLNDIADLIKSPLTSTSLLQFIGDFLDDVGQSKMNLMPAIYKYMGRELSSLEPIDISFINNFNESKMEEIAVVLEDYLDKDPNSIDTAALDWLFELKINIVTQRKSNLFDISEKTFQQAKERRDERRRAFPLKRSGKTMPYRPSPIKLDDDDRRTLHRIIGV